MGQPRRSGEQGVERVETLWNPFRVVESVDPDADQRRLDPQLPPQPSHLRLKAGVSGNGLDAIEVNADRRGADGGGVVRRMDPTVVNGGPQLGAGRGQEIASVPLELEREEIRRRQAFKNLSTVGTDPERVRMRERNVPEQRDTRVRTPLSQVVRHQREVIVLNEHWSHSVRQLVIDGACEPVVDSSIHPPVFGPEYRFDVRHMR